MGAFLFFRRADERADERRKNFCSTNISHMERCRYKQLNKQEYFQKYDNAFYRIMVKISV